MGDDASLASPPHLRCHRHISPDRPLGFGIYRDIAQLQADRRVVGTQHDGEAAGHDTHLLDPRVATTVKRRPRALCLGTPPKGTREDHDIDAFAKQDPIQETVAMAAKRLHSGARWHRGMALARDRLDDA